MTEFKLPTKETNILLDTVMISYFIKSDTRSDFYHKYVSSGTKCLSFISIAELYYWAYSKNWGTKRINDLEAKIRECVILPYDYQICTAWAKIKNLKGHPIQDNDCWIAASALHYNCYLASDNWKDFKHIGGLKLISPGH